MPVDWSMFVSAFEFMPQFGLSIMLGCLVMGVLVIRKESDIPVITISQLLLLFWLFLLGFLVDWIRKDQVKVMHSGVQKTKRASVTMRKGNNVKKVRKNLDTLAKVLSDIAPGPGWKSKCVLVGRKREQARRYWISPSEGIIFQFRTLAFEFEFIRQQSDGDEGRALDIYKKTRKAAGKKPYIMNHGRLGRAVKGEAMEKKTPTPGKRSFRALKPTAALEDGTESSDQIEA